MVYTEIPLDQAQVDRYLESEIAGRSPSDFIPIRLGAGIEVETTIANLVQDPSSVQEKLFARGARRVCTPDDLIAYDLVNQKVKFHSSPDLVSSMLMVINPDSRVPGFCKNVAIAFNEDSSRSVCLPGARLGKEEFDWVEIRLLQPIEDSVFTHLPLIDLHASLYGLRIEEPKSVLLS